MECKQIREHLSAYLDGQLTGSDRKHFKSHLENCHDCQKEYLETKSLIRQVRTLPEVPAPTDFLIKLRDRIDNQRATFWQKIFSRLDARLNAIPLRALSLAAALILAVGIYWAGQDRGKIHQMVKVAKDNQHSDLPEILSSSTEPLPVEFASTNPPASSAPLYIETPNELINKIINNDPDFGQYQVLPHPRGLGALIKTPEYLVEVTVDPAEFPMIQAYLEQQGGRLPSSLREAKSMFPIYVKFLPSPTAPIAPR